MKFLTKENITRILGIVFMLTGGVYIVYSLFGLEENYYFNNQTFSLIYGVASLGAGYGLLKKMRWAVYGFILMLFLEIVGEYFYTESGLALSDIFFFFAGLAAAYYLFFQDKKN